MGVLESTLTKDQLEHALDAIVALISSNSGGAFKNDVPFEFDMTTAGPDLAANAIRSIQANGIVVIRNYMNRDLASSIAERVFGFIENIRPEIRARRIIETDRYIIPDLKDPRFANYYQVSHCPKPVIYIRKGDTDDGMVDIFNVDRLHEDWKPHLEAIKSDFVMSVVNGYSDLRYQALNTNVYYNDSITRTRGFHADSYTPQMKAFIYLTDVACEEDGPHYYALGTHRDMAARQVNIEIGKAIGTDGTDFPFFDKNRAVRLLGQRGTLIISLQCGAHRGAPQAVGHRRLALVQNFMPIR